MKFKCKYLESDKLTKTGTLYKILKSREITVDEERTKDRVIIEYIVQNGQYGICCSEYKPPFIDDEGAKKVDVLVLVIDEKNKKFSSWILDMKQSVGGEDVIFHLLEQLQDSLKHKNALAIYMDDFREEQHLGFVTRDLQIERIEESVKKREKELNDIKKSTFQMFPIIRNKGMIESIKLKKEIETLSMFLDKKMKIKDQIYPIESYISEKQGEYFVYNLQVQCG
mgnify:CR=1 FL=1